MLHCQYDIRRLSFMAPPGRDSQIKTCFWLVACHITKATRHWNFPQAEKRHAVTRITAWWLSCCVNFLTAAVGLWHTHHTLLRLIQETVQCMNAKCTSALNWRMFFLFLTASLFSLWDDNRVYVSKKQLVCIPHSLGSFSSIQSNFIPSYSEKEKSSFQSSQSNCRRGARL